MRETPDVHTTRIAGSVPSLAHQSSGMAGYSGTPLVKKLGVKSGQTFCVISGPTGYEKLLGPLPEGARLTSRFTKSAAIVQIFVTDRAVLATTLAAYRRLLGPEANVWVSWPKKSSKVDTDITEDVIREVALPLGFVDVKVCAVTEVWSGLKLVVRKALRPSV